MVYFNSNNSNSNSGSNNAGKESSGQNSIIYILLFGFALFLMVYIIYTYFRPSQVSKGYTYYASDINNLNPLFSEKVQNVTECVDLCKKQPNCDGITFSEKKNVCIGQNEGRLRTDTDEYSAWVKTKKFDALKTFGEINSLNDGQRLLSNLNSKSRVVIDTSKIPIPPLLDQFSFSFWITIYDWYSNYSYWRHIFHKGTAFDQETNRKIKTLKIRNWEQIVEDLPNQCVGVWLTPFQNNIRIAVTTKAPGFIPQVYDEANVEKCGIDESGLNDCWITDLTDDPKFKQVPKVIKSVMKVEYVDIQDMETGVPTNIAVNIKGNIIEVYVNGKYKVSQILAGTPVWNEGDMYIHNPVSYKGILEDFRSFPGIVNQTNINDIYKYKNTSSEN
jgi:hypothetical protein